MPMNPRTKARLAAGTIALGGVMCTALPAHAALLPSPASSAFVVQAEALGGFAAVPATPTSAYPAGGTNTMVGISVGPFASDATLTATTAGDPATGTSSASATVENLGVTLPLGVSVSLTGINSTCTATPTGATGSGLIAGGQVNLPGAPLVKPIKLTVNAAPNTTIAVPGVASIVLNEQATDPATGVLTVNALHIKLLGGAGANVIIGQAKCGGSLPVTTNQTPMISAPVAAGAGATAAVGGVVMVRRRKRDKNVFDAS
jgi:hypothetical protein